MMNTSTVTAIPRFEIKINPQIDSIKWGDVVWVDFGNEAIGSELKGVHPAVVIQNNVGELIFRLHYGRAYDIKG